MAKANPIRIGDTVRWKSHGGTATGTVKKQVTKRTHIKDHVVAASEDSPQFIVETDEGKRAAHKPDALTKT